MSQSDGPSTPVSLLGHIRRNPADPQNWRAIVDRYGPLIYDWARGHGLQDADAKDVTQDVLLRLVRRLPTFEYDTTRTFRGFLRAITRNAWIDFVEGCQGRERGSGDSDVLVYLHKEPTRDDLIRRLEEDADRELFEIACREAQLRVAPRTWEAFRLGVLEDLPAREVAERLGMKLATVYGAQRTVRDMLKELVQKIDRREGS